jgi:hypothetical protein
MNGRLRPGGRRHRVLAGLTIVAMVTLIATPALAAPVDGQPDPTGMPGAALVRQLINWLMCCTGRRSGGVVPRSATACEPRTDATTSRVALSARSLPVSPSC